MRKWIVVAAVCCMGVVVLAAANNPVPGALQKAARPQGKASDAKQPASSDQPGTDERALVTQIKDAPKAQADPSKAHDQRGDKPAFWWGMTAEENTAAATYALVVVGALTALVLIVQSFLLRQTVNGAREEFRASHPPQLRIKHVIAQSDIWAGKPLDVSLVFVNIGKNTAYIRDVNVTATVISHDKRLPPEPKYPERKKNSVPPLSRGVALRTENIRVIRELTQDEQDGIFHPSRTKLLYCYGYVLYSDQASGNDAYRKTAFCRIWEPAVGTGRMSLPGRFVLHDDPDYEYQE